MYCGVHNDHDLKRGPCYKKIRWIALAEQDIFTISKHMLLLSIVCDNILCLIYLLFVFIL